MSVRRAWIERGAPGQSQPLPVSRQWALAGVVRSWVYGPRREEVLDELDLELLGRIDAEYTRRPFYGSRRMVLALSEQGHTVNRKRVQGLMRVLGLVGMAPALCVNLSPDTAGVGSLTANKPTLEWHTHEE